MKSPEVCKKFNNTLKPLLKQSGFKKISSSRPKWYKEYDDFVLHIYLKTGKYSWEPYCGCKIALEAYICPKGTPHNEVECESKSSRRFFEKGSNKVLTINKRNSLVVEKIKSIDLREIIDDPENWYDDLEEIKLLHESSLLFIDDKKDIESTELFMATEAMYLDGDDVAYLCDFSQAV